MAPRRRKQTLNNQVENDVSVENTETTQPEIEVADEIISIDLDEDEPIKPKKIEKPVVKHSYNETTGKFTAEKKDGTKLELNAPTVLPDEYCVIARKFVPVNYGVCIGKYTVGSFKNIDYSELDKVPEGSLDAVHCYNIFSEQKLDMIQKVLSKIRFGGRCFIVDTSVDLRNVLKNMVGIHIIFCGYGYTMFNHKYWHDNKNISIAWITKG